MAVIKNKSKVRGTKIYKERTSGTEKTKRNGYKNKRVGKASKSQISQYDSGQWNFKNEI